MVNTCGKNNKVIIREIFIKIKDMDMEKFIGIMIQKFIKVNGKMECKMVMERFRHLMNTVEN